MGSTTFVRVPAGTRLYRTRTVRGVRQNILAFREDVGPPGLDEIEVRLDRPATRLELPSIWDDEPPDVVVVIRPARPEERG